MTDIDWKARAQAAEAKLAEAVGERDRFKRALPECEACNGTGHIDHGAVLTGPNLHSACRMECDACEGTGVEL